MAVIMAYSPQLEKQAVLRTGAGLHAFFDHPNHAGFSQADHADAAHWHHSKAMEHEHFKELDQAKFHHAQGILHARAASGESTRMRKAPSEEVLNTLTPDRRVKWDREIQRINKDNAELKALEPFRMTNMLSKCAPTLTKNDDSDMVKKMIRQRQAVRSGRASEGDEVAPEVDEDQKAKIREAIANARSRRGG
jgi:hypothetical protein